jgi:hypothetical protein
MNKWISVKEKLPETCKDCLLFIKQYRSDSGYLWADHIIKGFWSDEMYDNEIGFYADNFYVSKLGLDKNKLDATGCYEFLSDCKYIDITHWMPLPEAPE